MAGSSVNWYKPTAGALKGQAVYLSNKQQQTLLGALAAGDMRAGVLKKLNNGGKKAVAVANTQQPAGVSKLGNPPKPVQTVGVYGGINTGKQQVEATLNKAGTLAVHKNVFGSGYTVTQVTTGNMLGSAKTEAEADALVAKLDSLPTKWGENEMSIHIPKMKPTGSGPTLAMTKPGLPPAPGSKPDPQTWLATPLSLKQLQKNNVLYTYEKIAAPLSPDGNLAYHKNRFDNGYAVTHARTGEVLVGGFATKEDARAAADKAQYAPVDWNYNTSKGGSNALHKNAGNAAALATLVAELTQDAKNSVTKKKAIDVQVLTPEGVTTIKGKPGQTAYALAPSFAGQITLNAKRNDLEANQDASSLLQRGLLPPPPTEEQQAGITHFQEDSSVQMLALVTGSRADAAPEVGGFVKDMDDTMDALIMPYSFSVTRTVGNLHADGQTMNVINVGDTWMPQTFQSAKVDSPENAWGGGQIRMHYRIPEGARGVGLHMNSTHESLFSPEVEFTVARATEWRVIAKSQSAGGRMDVVLEYIGKSPAYTPGQWDKPAPGSDMRRAKK